MASSLLTRLDHVELFLFGNTDIVEQQTASVLTQRLQNLSASLHAIDVRVPDLKENLDICLQLEREFVKSSYMTVDVKIEELLATRGELLKSINMLDNIKTHTRVLDKDFEIQDTLNSKGVQCNSKERLFQIENHLMELQGAHNLQTTELNLLLDTYETLVSHLSLKSIEWDRRLSSIEHQDQDHGHGHGHGQDMGKGMGMGMAEKSLDIKRERVGLLPPPHEDKGESEGEGEEQNEIKKEEQQQQEEGGGDGDGEEGEIESIQVEKVESDIDAAMITREVVEAMSYRELVNRAKQIGVKASGKKDELLERILLHFENSL